jgi:hypothetical protein
MSVRFKMTSAVGTPSANLGASLRWVGTMSFMEPFSRLVSLGSIWGKTVQGVGSLWH